MTQSSGLIYGRHIKSPEFKFTDSIVRHRESTTLITSANSIISPKYTFNSQSAFRITPVTAPFTETLDARTSSLTHNPILSEIDPLEPEITEIIPIPDLYNIPAPSHRRNRTEIPNISLRELEASTIRQTSNIRDISMNVSKSTAVLPRMNNNSASILRSPSSTFKTPFSLKHLGNDDDTRFEHYLEYLHLNTNNDAVRRSVEFKAKSVTNKRSRLLFPKHESTIKIPEIQEQVPATLIKLNLNSSPRKEKEKESPNLRSMVTKAFPNLKDLTFDAIKETSSPAKKSARDEHGAKIEISPKIEQSPHPTQRKTGREITIVEDTSSFNKGMNSPTSNSTPMNNNTSSNSIPKLLRSNSRSPFKTKLFEKWHNDQERMLTNLAQNLANLWEKVKNEQKMDSCLDKFCDRNKILINLFDRPQGKQSDYNFERILRRFKLIEFGPEPSFVPLRMKKKKMGVTFIDPLLLPKIEKASQMIEAYLASIRKAEMKMVEDHILKAEIRLDQIHKDKFKAMKLNGKIKEYVAAQKILDGKPRIDPYYFYKFDAVKEYESFKDSTTYVDTTYINPKHIEHAKTLAEVFNSWSSVISRRTGAENLGKE